MTSVRRVVSLLLMPLRSARARRTRSFIDERATSPMFVDGFATAFPEGDAAYNGMGSHDGQIYFTVATRDLEVGARLFRFDPATQALTIASDLDRDLSSKRSPTIPHGKVHVDLGDVDGVLYGATQNSHYRIVDGIERPGSARGYGPYPGGYFFAFDGQRVTALAQASRGQGIITMSADPMRRVLHALTWPDGNLLSLDLASCKLENHGAVFGVAENGSRKRGDWNRVCRSLGVEPDTGSVFWSDQRGRVMRRAGTQIAEVASMPRPEMWRKVFWHPQRRAFYGVGWNSNMLFRFDPRSMEVEDIALLSVVDRDPPPATLAFALDAERDLVYSIVTGPGILRPGQSQLSSSAWFVTCDLSSQSKSVAGPMRLRDGRWLTLSHSLTLTDDFAYATAWVAISDDDRTPSAMAIRRIRRKSVNAPTKSYEDEMMLVRIAR